jgi:phospholipase C
MPRIRMETKMFRTSLLCAFSRKLPAIIIALAIAAGTSSISYAESKDRVESSSSIKHIIVIFQENVSFDHYFGTYPHAENSLGELAFHAKPNTPKVNGLTFALRKHNPNSSAPFRLSRKENYTCDQDHAYKAEQKAFDQGRMDLFPENTGNGNPNCPDYGHGKGLVMGYYDGNVVTALWNYAQHFAMSDAFFDTVFGPSTPGHLNLIAGQTFIPKELLEDSGNLVDDPDNPEVDVVRSPLGTTIIGDPDPYYDDCSGPERIGLNNYDRLDIRNVGDLLNNKGITWGWFQGGFRPTVPYAQANINSKAVCGAATVNGSSTAPVADYSPHHEPFQYFKRTSNPHHLPPSSVDKIGQTDQANHQYDLIDFWAAATSGHLPAVSFLKPKRAQNGHAGNSSPLDEQQFLVDTLNKLQKLPEWKDSAVFITWDDSDGWYDHALGPIVNASMTSADALNGPGTCGISKKMLSGIQGRCGYGARLPLLIISPYANRNFIDHTTTDHTSILRFIEENYQLGQLGNGSFDGIAGSLKGMFDFNAAPTQLFLDPWTGQILPEK